MQEYLHQTEDAGVSPSTADAGVSPSDSGRRSISIREWMQETLYLRADAVFSLSDSGCGSLDQTANAGDSLSDS